MKGLREVVFRQMAGKFCAVGWRQGAEKKVIRVGGSSSRGSVAWRGILVNNDLLDGNSNAGRSDSNE
jgi:hypothetical protein